MKLYNYAAAVAASILVLGVPFKADADVFAGSASQSQAGAVSGSASLSSTDGNSQSITFNGSDIPTKTQSKVTMDDRQTRKIWTTPDVAPPALTTSFASQQNGTCMGSSSVGASGGVIGASIGTTWIDEECQRRYNAQYLMTMGLQEAAKEELCGIESVYNAMKRSGGGCSFREDFESEAATTAYLEAKGPSIVTYAPVPANVEEVNINSLAYKVSNGLFTGD